MDSFDFDSVKAEKANAMLRYRRLRKMAKLFRVVELCVALGFLSWISTRLPFAVRISGEYFRQLFAVIVSPLFVFIVGNAIVITLLAKSGLVFGHNPTGNNARTDLYEEYIKNGDSRIKSRSEGPSLSQGPAEIVYQDKQVICEVNAITTPTCIDEVADTDSDAKVYRRSQSEKLWRESSEKPCGKLRRSETEKCQKILSSGETPAEPLFPEDDLSNEEFRRTIEEFIAKQAKFHREESFTVVLQNRS